MLYPLNHVALLSKFVFGNVFLLILCSSQSYAQSTVAGTSIRIPNQTITASGRPPGILYTNVNSIFPKEPEDNLNVFMQKLLKHYPKQGFLIFNTEISNRFESNVLQTALAPRRDYVFRTNPDIQLGYRTFKQVDAYCDYNMLKDIYAVNHSLSIPTSHFLTIGAKRNFQVTNYSSFVIDCSARENWTGRNQNSADLLPAAYYTKSFDDSDPNHPPLFSNVFGSVILQMHSKKFFQGATQEIDPAYSIGFDKPFGDYTLSVTDTLITNFRDPPFHTGNHGNVQMITAAEVNKSINSFVQGFMRLESVWNWDSGGAAGNSGYDCRTIAGIRLSVDKEAENRSSDNSANRRPIDVKQRILRLIRPGQSL